jgi:hypothetical protein
MNQRQKLEVLRDKLIARRRALIDSLWQVGPENLTGDGLARIQDAIDAANRALGQERRAEASHELGHTLQRIPAVSR